MRGGKKRLPALLLVTVLLAVASIGGAKTKSDSQKGRTACSECEKTKNSTMDACKKQMGGAKSSCEKRAKKKLKECKKACKK